MDTKYFKPYFDRFTEHNIDESSSALLDNLFYLYDDSPKIATELIDGWLEREEDPEKKEKVQKAFNSAKKYYWKIQEDEGNMITLLPP